MVFEIATTNLVIELGIILALLLGWQFTLAEFIGGPIMIVLVALAFRLFVRKRLIDAAREQAEQGGGRVDGGPRRHGHERRAPAGASRRRLLSRDGYTAVSHIFVMEWAAVIRDIVIGLLIAGAVGAWVPDTFWQHLFLTGHPLAAKLWGPLIGPVISVLSFVCSIGNVPLAGGAVERRDQLRRRHRVHLRRPDHHPDPDHLPEVLRHQDDAGPARRSSTPPWSRPATSSSSLFGGLGLIPTERHAKVDETRHQLELHDHPQHRLPAARRRAAGAVLPLRRRPDAQDDGRWPRRARTPHATRASRDMITVQLAVQLATVIDRQ